MNQAKRITTVTAFIDWNSQIHAARADADSTPITLTQQTLRYIGRTIGRVLASVDRTARFDVNLRLYHGWYRGFEPTPRRKAMIEVFAGTDFAALSNQSNVVIRPSLNFGDSLESATSARYFPHLSCHIPNTLRRDIIDKDVREEKMVDTAIASEFVDLAHREPDRWLMLVGEDDDLVPPTYIAEGIRGGVGGKILLVRSRGDTPFLKLDQLRYAPS